MLAKLTRWPSFPVLGFFFMSLIAFVIAGWGIIGVAALPWDAGWYGGIALNGYAFDGDYSTQQNIAFFPLTPMITGLVRQLAGTANIWSVQLFCAAAMTLASSLLLHRVALHLFGEPLAKMSIGLYLANPFAIYLFNGYSESVLILSIATFFYFLLVKPRMHWVTLSIIAASLARPYGIFLVVVFVLYLLTEWRWGKERKWEPVLLIHVPLSFAGYIGWCLYCDQRFGDPMASLHATQAWLGPQNPVTAYGLLVLDAPLQAIQDAVRSEVLADPVAVGAIFFCGGLALFVSHARRFPAALLLFGLLLPAMVYPGVIGQKGGVYNAGRYETVYFVHYIALAMLLLSLDRRVIRAEEPGAPGDTALPMIFYPVYVGFLAGFMRYAHYFFTEVWVS